MATTKPLTKKEKVWVHQLQDVLMNPPTERLGLFTTGDASLSVYDLSRSDEINKIQDSGISDFGPAVDSIGARLGEAMSKNCIESTAG
jgi:hypothetical protein